MASTLSPAVGLPTANAGLYGRLLLVMLFWGGSFIAGRQLALHMPHFIAAAARYAVAVVLLLGYLWQREGLPRPSGRQWAEIAVLGATGVFAYNAFFFGALERLPAGRAALIIATVPALTAVSSWLIFRLRFAWWQWLGVAVAFFGVAIVVSRGDFATLASGAIGAGELLMLGCAFSWLVYTLVGRAMLRRPGALSPLATTAYASALGFLLLAGAAAFEVPQLSSARVGWTEVAAIVYMGLFGTALAFVWFYEGVKQIGAARATVFGNLVPMFGVSLAVLVLGEPLLASMVIGGLVTLGGVSLTNLERQRA